jgi:hypothetical protein
MDLDFDHDVVGLSFTLSWKQDGENWSHAPDHLARLRDGTGVVISIRSGGRVKPEDAGTARACESVGWGFRHVGAVTAVRAASLRWLPGYRHPQVHGW